ncbi:TPA: shufflon system plasmid conjugative transfer pilus tip adhesin PilV [Klebsiella variicola subsp. variicola]|uniref:shufflon system plasmid conjugative transfer pilus tip adhesin PilV n=2 Tax=Enterobacterales TaxID=91347 RepID=UPI000BE45FFC|nr:shufflon system plasmid conjugative transfer pilus tip adhesin PilV [Escherichia coli]EFO2096468.1 shufflon system plasmid conjugative transfer pilus tip adhesin PilV [Escherichia coli O19]RVR29695.1 shufflon system plasmid conjugative transfer pilus tip adhesin PilV [Citrobacter freundii]HED2914248.1 shufflon system plasmid conjugative transfer pilus tip adhesin PilV [Klebsiella variicola subsp. variicola]EFN5263535.1 shufflon system plasmid conjugative transfer pilus tip adhesin PilV [Esch
MAMKMKIKKGFSLLELTLVLGVGTMVAFMKFQDMKNEQESIMASAVGQQMKQIGEAVNGYINIRYDKLSTLSNAAGTGTDPGPRTCSGSVCEITYQTLINEGLLPSTYTGTNANKSSYKIILKRDGTSPNYVINGLITTSTAWIEGGKTRYDLLGKAMQTAGIDSGMTKTTSIASGHSGQWSETSANFNNITSTGQLAFRVGYNSALYSFYLRRDGTLPMTGDLNLDGHNINNIANINATGNITTTGNVFGKDINASGLLATNGFSTSDKPDGWAGGIRTFDIYASGGYYLTYQGATAKSKDWAFMVDNSGVAALKKQLSVGGDSAAKTFPTGWGGNNGTGIKTFDVYASGTVGAGDENGNLKAYINTYGDIHADRNINASGNIDANGRINAGEFVYINGQANIGWGCSPNGVVGRTPEGKVISCVNGVWSGSTGSPVIRTAYASAYRFPGAVAYCAGSEKVVGGGGQCNTAEGYVWLTVSRPNGDNSWYAGCDTTKNITATITVYAICQ